MTQPRLPWARARASRVHFLSALIALFVLCASVFTPSTAWAAPTAVTFSNQQFDRASSTSSENIKFSFDWTVADNALGGDTFTIVLPNELRPVNTAAFALKNGSGNVVANAMWSGKVATFTLTDFVNGLSNVNGSAYFTISWDRSIVNTEAGGNYDLHFSGTRSWNLGLELIPDGATGEGQSTSKVGWWLSDDQGATSSIAQLGWVVYLETGTSDHIDAPVVIVDTPGPSSRINVNSVVGYVNGAEMAQSRYTVEREGIRGIRIELQGNYPGESAVYEGEDIYFMYKSNLLPGENGVFSNAAVITGLDKEPQRVGAQVLRAGAGGDGNGDVRTVTPAMPDVTQATCNTDGTNTAPIVTLPNTEGITYTSSGTPAAGGTVTLTATAADGFQLGTTTGWELADDNLTATTTLTFNDVECEQPALATTGSPILLPWVPIGIGLLVVGGATFAAAKRKTL